MCLICSLILNILHHLFIYRSFCFQSALDVILKFGMITQSYPEGILCCLYPSSLYVLAKKKQTGITVTMMIHRIRNMSTGECTIKQLKLYYLQAYTFPIILLAFPSFPVFLTSVVCFAFNHFLPPYVFIFFISNFLLK